MWFPVHGESFAMHLQVSFTCIFIDNHMCLMGIAMLAMYFCDALIKTCWVTSERGDQCV